MCTKKKRLPTKKIFLSLMNRSKNGKIISKKKWIKEKYQNYLNRAKKKNKNMKKQYQNKRRCQRKFKVMLRNSIRLKMK
jgi:hypothetical protein